MDDLQALAEEQLHAPNYLKSVTEMGDVHPLVTTRDIYSTTNIKLVAKGMRINSSLYSHLLNHRLAPPLDQCIAADNAVNSRAMAGQAIALLAQDKQLEAMQAAMAEEQERLGEILAAVPLNPAIAFKLTVMREQRPTLFHHSLQVILVSCYMGMQLGLFRRQLEELAAAALLHDIGIMHVDPALLDHSHRMNEQERKHLYAHPLTAWMILNECPEYSSEVRDAVLQHHERMDGSGYPRRLTEKDIGLYGQIVAVAEIVASRLGQDGDGTYERLRLETILKLNTRRFGRQLVGCLKVFYQESAGPVSCTEQDRQSVHAARQKVDAVLASWKACSSDHQVPREVCNFINQRMQLLMIDVLDAGVFPENSGQNFPMIDESPEACLEMKALLEEAVWQVHGIQREIRQRWPMIGRADGPPGLLPVSDWMSEIERILAR